MVSNELYISTVLLAGILSFFAPCIVPLLPVYVGVLSDDTKKSYTLRLGKHPFNMTRLIKTMVFVAGLGTVFLLLGFGAGVLGSLIYSKTFLVVIGMVVIVLGLHQTGLLHLAFFDKQKSLHIRGSQGGGLIGTYLLGLTFSFGWTPCIGPVLGAVLGLSATGNSVVYGGFLMLIYTLGLMIPFMVITIFSEVLLDKVKKINPYLGKIKVVGGVLIMVMGILLMTGQMTTITVWVEQLIGTL